ncbi:MAG TPA: hypothetical protein EYQ20_16380 [candidate division Zixibacteria bacterium]|nr:hypothetical protein [candidate division Zixibacteria bacterium]
MVENDPRVLRLLTDLLKAPNETIGLFLYRFVLFLPQATDDAIMLRNRIESLLEGQRVADQFEPIGTARYGIAHCPQGSRPADMLLVAAKRAIDNSDMD